jgi:hypothetical protein
MKIKVTPSLPEADLVLMRWHMAKAVARIRLHEIDEHVLTPDTVAQRVDLTDLTESLGLQATIKKQLTEAYRSATVDAMQAIHDCEFAAGDEPLLSEDVACLIDAEVARWRDGILGVDEGVMRAAGIECTRFDYACRWN